MDRSKMHAQRTHSVGLKCVCVPSLLGSTIVFSTCKTVCKDHVLYASALCMCCAQEYMLISCSTE